MTIHLQESAEQEFLTKLVKFRKAPQPNYPGPVSVHVYVVGGDIPLDGSALETAKKRNRKRERDGLPPTPLTRPTTRKLEKHELRLAWFVQEVEVRAFGSNPPMRLRIWHPDSGCYDLHASWNVMTNLLVSFEEAPPTKEKGVFYDVKRRRW